MKLKNERMELMLEEDTDRSCGYFELKKNIKGERDYWVWHQHSRYQLNYSDMKEVLKVHKQLEEKEIKKIHKEYLDSFDEKVKTVAKMKECYSGAVSDTEDKERCVTLDLLKEVNKVLLRHAIKEWKDGVIIKKVKFPRDLMSTIKVHMENLEK